MANRVRGILERLLGRQREIAVGEFVSDTELLQRFAANRDEAAFELIVWRHGPMVLGLCRRAVRDEQLAEDAFQAVFLVLARRAGVIRSGNVGGWLFGVARKVAARAARGRPVTHAVPEVPVDDPPLAVEHRELAAILDAEVARLPERFRSVVVLCYLGGHTTEAAARELGCPRGTILSRLAAARKRLAERLTRRGVTLPAIGLFVADLTTTRLVSQTVSLAQNPFPGPVATGPALLAESVVRSMTTTKLALACGSVLLAAGLTLGVSWVAAGTGPAEVPGTAIEVAAQAQPAKPAGQKSNPTAERLRNLQKQSDELASRIEGAQLRVSRAQEADGAVDVSVLQAELFDLEKKILAAENQQKTHARDLDRAVKEQEAALKRGITESWIDEHVAQASEVITARNALQKANLLVESVAPRVAAESPVMKAAKKEVADAAEALDAARKKARPTAERTARASVERRFANQVEHAKDVVESGVEQLKDYLRTREQLAARLAEAKRGETKRQFAQDELRVLREIQSELLRQRTLAELGVEGLPLPAARSELPAKVELELKSLRQTVDELQREVEGLRKKR